MPIFDLDQLAKHNKRLDDMISAPQQHPCRISKGEMVVAAACYLLASKPEFVRVLWPWHLVHWDPKSNQHNLLWAITLLIRELERVSQSSS